MTISHLADVLYALVGVGGDMQAKRESAKARQAFGDYWALGPDRSLAKLAQKKGKGTAYRRRLEKWSCQFRWQERIAQRDQEIALAEFEAEKQARAEMRERHIATARALLAIAQRAIRYLSENEKEKELSPSLLPAYVKTAAELERLARGESTTNVAMAVHQTNYVDERIQELMRNDPEFPRIASEFFERLTMAQEDA